jgi:hypothetical protein
MDDCYQNNNNKLMKEAKLPILIKDILLNILIKLIIFIKYRA